MDRFIARQNIERFTRQLAEARDPARRERLAGLLAEAEEALRRAEAAHAAAAHLQANPDDGEREGDQGPERLLRGKISDLRGQLSRERSDARRAALERLLVREEARLRETLVGRDSRPDGDHEARRGRITVIVEQLQVETVPTQRQSLRQRLIEEEDRFGRLSQQLDLADGHIEDGVRRIERLERLVAGSHIDEALRRRHASNLANSREILDIFQSYRASLADRAGCIDL